MGIAWIKKFCPSCKKKTRFEFIGTQKTKKQSLELWNCTECHTTKAIKFPTQLLPVSTIGSH